MPHPPPRSRLGSLLASPRTGVFLAALLIAACSNSQDNPHQETASSPSAYQVEEASTGYEGPVVPMAGFDWSLARSLPQWRLAYGRDDRNDTPLSLSCTNGSGQVQIIITHGSLEGDDPTAPIRLATDTLGADLPVQSSLLIAPGTIRKSATISANAPLLNSFQETRWLAFFDGSEWVALAPQEGTFVEVGAFLNHCN